MKTIHDPWVHILQQIEPKYLELADLMETGPKILATLTKRRLRWQVRIHEDWGSADQPDRNPGYGKLDKRCDWATEQLVNWKFVKRISYQDWIFFNKTQAEKFLTLYNLKWAE